MGKGTLIFQSFMMCVSLGAIIHFISENIIVSSITALILFSLITTICFYIDHEINKLQNRISEISVRQREQEKRKMSL